MVDINVPNRLKVGKVNFLNTFPIFYPLETGVIRHNFQIIEGSPTTLNSLLAWGELDLGVVSSVEYAHRFEDYLLLPDLSISSRNQVRSVLLLTRVPLEELNGQEILLTPKSFTSIALLKLLFSRRFAVEPRYRVEDYHLPDCRWPSGAAAVLAIGDDALRLRKCPEVRLALDLGEAWHEWTGHSFVYAVWALRKEAIARKDGLVHQAVDTLLAAREYALRHKEMIAATAARQRSWCSHRECFEYLQNIEYDLDEDKRWGLELFYHMLYEMGELSRRVPLNFLALPTGSD